jgi:hypothetical protein
MNGARRIFERRLTMIMRDRVSCRLSWTALGAVFLLGLAAMPGWSSAVDEPKKPKKEAVYALQVAPAPEPETAEARPFVVLYDQKSDDPANGDDREKRLQALEKQVKALLKEVRALRGGQAESADQVLRFRTVAPKAATIVVSPVPAADAAPTLAPPTPAPSITPPAAVYSAVPASPPAKARFWINARVPEPDSEDVVVNEHEDIVVKKYKLPASKAEKLAALLEDVHGVKEAKADKNGLTVKSTQKAANTIQAMVRLMAEQAK